MIELQILCLYCCSMFLNTRVLSVLMRAAMFIQEGIAKPFDDNDNGDGETMAQ